MSTIIIYFSLLGHNREIAKEIADKENCESLEFSPGSNFRGFQYFMGKKKLAKKAKKLNSDVATYDEIVICGPIWGRKPAPAVKILLENLNMKGKKVRCYLTFTQDHGNSENIVRDMIQENRGELIDLKFTHISEKFFGKLK